MKKKLHFIGSSRDDLRKFPKDVKIEFGQGLYNIELSGTPLNAKALKGFKGTMVMELKANEAGDTYRCMYTAKFEHAVYVLHAFQKKSKSGIKTPKHDMEIIRKRLQAALEHHKMNYERDNE